MWERRDATRSTDLCVRQSVFDWFNDVVDRTVKVLQKRSGNSTRAGLDGDCICLDIHTIRVGFVHKGIDA